MKDRKVKKYYNVAKIDFYKYYLLIEVDGRDYTIYLRRYSSQLASAKV